MISYGKLIVIAILTAMASVGLSSLPVFRTSFLGNFMAWFFILFLGVTLSICLVRKLLGKEE